VNKSDKNSSLLLTMMDDLSLEQCVSSPTRKSSLLDLVFTNSRDLISWLIICLTLITIALNLF